jgi:hypothetical protein
MAQPARRRRTHPSIAPPQGPSEPPDPPDDATEWVTCFLSGERVPKDKAVLVRLGRGKTMWMAADLTAQGKPDK